MDDRANTIAGWVLGAAIVALGATIVSSEIFNGERPEKMGYPIEGAEEAGPAGAAAEKPIAFYLASADPAKGADVFKKCASCHNAEPGGANAIGPNLYGVIGKPHGHLPNFAYSSGMKAKPGVWDFDALSTWLHKPKAYIEGTKMAFAGLSDPQDRANVIAYLNSKSPAPLPMPAVPTDAAGGPTAEPAQDSASNRPGTGTANNGPQKAEDEPVLTEQQVAKSPKGNIGGEGAPKVTGTAAQTRK